MHVFSTTSHQNSYSSCIQRIASFEKRVKEARADYEVPRTKFRELLRQVSFHECLEPKQKKIPEVSCILSSWISLIDMAICLCYNAENLPRKLLCTLSFKFNSQTKFHQGSSLHSKLYFSWELPELHYQVDCFDNYCK